MSARLPSGVVVGALLRRVNDSGGLGMVLARGDAQAGSILVLTRKNGGNPRFLERGIGFDGTETLVVSGPQDTDNEQEIMEYCARRRRSDPDLWVIELDSPAAERFAAETILGR
ncbi:DUF1491 family protein [Hephaestia sp. GCM10023244]|uniref:DUF1491 family protein n=1 Tax=unclassified Hephaestia TaxID=2631281 RepID=UPI0020772D05|nr:DUF1491 family protein [Hephaestia sp. MAHUQ-44]MCM8731164.1 DUF1491 family protein [Hephaestia sp. MAHUQ-44]